MRYSELRKLDWARNYGTRPALLAASQKELTLAITEQALSASKEGLLNPMMLLRSTLSTFGKGGDNGQRIRDQILEIMHRHKIGETYGTYMEQWHQKLHNNTTPDDIGICEATIAFNETNNMGKFWEVLTRHGITRERLASFDRPITKEPSYMPFLIPDLYNYLALLKSVHSGTDLNTSIDAARQFLNGEINQKLNEILGNLNHWDKIPQMERTVQARIGINKSFDRKNIFTCRELLYCDMALEVYIRQIAESIFHCNIGTKHLMRELNLLLENSLLTCESQEFVVASNDWKNIMGRFSESFENNVDQVLKLKAAADRLIRVLGLSIDAYNQIIDPKAKYLGNNFGVENDTVDIFTEEMIRGSNLFPLSVVLKKIDAQFRVLAKLKPWQIISPGQNSQGRLLQVESLHEVSYEVYKEPVILLAHKVTGEEEIPEGVKAIISCTELDGLAHVSVRARNVKVLLAICYDENEIRRIQEFAGNPVNVSLVSGGVNITRIDHLVEEEKVNIERPDVKKPSRLVKIAISANEFGDGKTGAKGNNCAFLRQSLPERIGVPHQAALPFGVCEFVLSLPINSERLISYNTLSDQLDEVGLDKSAEEILSKLQEIILNLEIDDENAGIIQEQLASINLPRNQWQDAFSAIKKVWASKYNERAYLSTLKAKISLRDVYMSVLCQEVIEGQYAYVLHTKDPFTNDSTHIYGEIVLGLGETLVGAYEGRAFSFKVNKAASEFTIENYPNKSVALYGAGFIFRSDSNSEDLPGFAGAGLFDSHIMNKPVERVVSYADEKLFHDEGFVREIIFKLREVGNAIENAFSGVAQDIEGVISNDRIYVVQSRPQV
mmetsp:Transcript_19098/g.19112  ORF Transcript_19098/g.19112 Transcript_19098/m.19112 type:complete len:837 (+) Transcript_19098:570-3080(+)